MKTLALTVAAMVIGGAAMTAHATVPVRIMVQEPVSYHDLNLERSSALDVAHPGSSCRPEGPHPGEPGTDEAEHQGSQCQSCTEATGMPSPQSMCCADVLCHQPRRDLRLL